MSTLLNCLPEKSADAANAHFHAKQNVHAQQRESLALAREIIGAAPNGKQALLELCEANPISALDMISNCPSLAVLLVRSCSPGKPEARSAYFRRLLEKPWRALLLDLNLPGRPRTIRILRKLPIEHSDPRTVDNLANMIRRPGSRFFHLLPHLSRITRDAVALMSRHPDVVTAKLLSAAAKTDPDELSVTWTVGAVRSLRKEQELQRGWPYSGLTFEKLMLVEGRLNDVIYRRSLKAFPAPPFAGIPKVIEPVCSYDRLLIETDEVHLNFLGGHSEILAGNLYFYSAHAPVRATIVLRREGADDVWRLHPICAADDTEVNAQTAACVLRWFCEVSAAATPKTKI